MTGIEDANFQDAATAFSLSSNNLTQGFDSHVLQASNQKLTYPKIKEVIGRDPYPFLPTIIL